MSEEISIGDYVSVNFHASQDTLGARLRVVYVPCSTGDVWCFKNDVTGEVHYVSEPCTVTKK